MTMDSCRPSKLAAGFAATNSTPRSCSTCTIRSEPARCTARPDCGGCALPTSRSACAGEGPARNGSAAAAMGSAAATPLFPSNETAPAPAVLPMNSRRLRPRSFFFVGLLNSMLPYPSSGPEKHSWFRCPSHGGSDRLLRSPNVVILRRYYVLQVRQKNNTEEN